MGIWYATREQVKSSLEIASTARADSLIDRKLESNSRNIEGLLHRRFYPERRTVLKDWPNYQYAPTWEIWLDGDEIISLETLTAGGTAISSNNIKLRRGDDRSEPPYSSIQIDLSSSASFSAGQTFQQAISILGLFGYKDTSTSVPAHALLGGNINSSVTTLTMAPTSNRLEVGVGSLLLIGTERIVIINRTMNDTTQNVQTAMAELHSDNIVDVTDPTLFALNETILIGAERMKVVDIAGNNLIVERAFDGTVLAAHSANDDIFALHTFLVQRGALGSTAAAHTSGDSIYAHDYELVNELCLAETVVSLEQNASGYARTVGSGQNAREAVGKGLEDLRNQAITFYGRKCRAGAV